MRISKIAVVIGILCVATPAISAFADGVPVATALVALNPAAPNPAMRAALKAKLQELRADIQAVRTAVQNRDKSAARAAVARLKTDWQALPPRAKQLIRQRRPQLFERMRAIMNRLANRPAGSQA